MSDPLLTRRDHARLSRLPARPEALSALLDNAELIPSEAVPGNVVTMYSRVLARGAQASQVLTLCYPEDAEPNRGFISVCSPVGTALLGRRLGEQVHWQVPAGSEARSLRIEALLFQPEASGDYQL